VINEKEGENTLLFDSRYFTLSVLVKNVHDLIILFYQYHLHCEFVHQLNLEWFFLQIQMRKMP
jgi:hypothetical protein